MGYRAVQTVLVPLGFASTFMAFHARDPTPRGRAKRAQGHEALDVASTQPVVLGRHVQGRRSARAVDQAAAETSCKPSPAGVGIAFTAAPATKAQAKQRRHHSLLP